MSEILRVYIPQETSIAPIETRDYLAPVVARIARFLPPEKIWEFFSSAPGETGGVIRFPYCRVDSALINCRDYLDMNMYEKASLQAMRAILWVEIGFQGLENLAYDPASKNWTSGVGHFVDDQERARRIIVNGKDKFEKTLHEFVTYRDTHQINDDCFTDYELETILSQWRKG